VTTPWVQEDRVDVDGRSRRPTRPGRSRSLAGRPPARRAKPREPAYPVRL